MESLAAGEGLEGVKGPFGRSKRRWRDARRMGNVHTYIDTVREESVEPEFGWLLGLGGWKEREDKGTGRGAMMGW